MNTNKIRTELLKIQDMCRSDYDCRSCHFQDSEGRCYFRPIPEIWNTEEINNIIQGILTIRRMEND